MVLRIRTPEGIAALASASVVPVLCPLVPLYLRQTEEAPAREMIRAGLAPALATDFNPGSCYVQSMPEVLTWAALRYGMNAREALCAATLNAAASLGRADRLGSIEVGKLADMVIVSADPRDDIRNTRAITTVIKNGVLFSGVDGGRLAPDPAPAEPMYFQPPR